MGCGSSKHVIDPTVEPNLSVIKESVDQRPKQLLRDIERFYGIYLDKKEALRPFIAERAGLQGLLDEEKERLVILLSKKDKFLKDRQSLMNYTWDRDADDIFRAFGKFSVDKKLLITVLMNRTKWQIEEIAKVFEKKYGKPLLLFIVSEMTTIMGTLATGGNTGLAKLLSYRVMLQPERDAAFLRDCSDGLGLDEEGLLETIMTRTNNELRAAIEAYKIEYKKDFIDIVRSKSSYANYREFMLKVLECDRDERNEPLPEEIATTFAEQLFEAGARRTIGIDPEPFIRILANINLAQFESINNCYKDKQLLKDIITKTGGSFQQALVSRCTDKYEFLARKVDKALKGFTADREALSRIFGSLKLHECIRLKDAYARLKFGGPANPKTLEQNIEACLSKGSFQDALIKMINSDPSRNPLGSYLEVVDESSNAAAEAEKGKAIAEEKYRKEAIIAKGEQLLKRSKSGVVQAAEPVGSYESGASHVFSNIDDWDNDLPKYSWDPLRGRFMDAPKLSKELFDCQQATKDVLLLRERISDEISGVKDVYFSIVQSCVEAEAWIRILTNHLQSLQAFHNRLPSAQPSPSVSSK